MDEGDGLRVQVARARCILVGDRYWYDVAASEEGWNDGWTYCPVDSRDKGVSRGQKKRRGILQRDVL